MLYRITLAATLLLSTLFFTTSAIAGVTTNKRTIYFEQGTIGAPQKEYVILDNEGDELVLIEEVQIVGPDADNFTTTYTGGLPRFIYPGQTPWLPVTFTPTTEEAQNAMLQLVVNNGQLINIGLNGNVQGSIVANKTTLDFGTLEEGESKTLSTILSNISKDLKIITAVKITGEGAENFSTNYTEKLPRFIYPGQEPWVNVTLDCETQTNSNAMLNMNLDNGASLQIELKGDCNATSSQSTRWVHTPDDVEVMRGMATAFTLQFISDMALDELEIRTSEEFEPYFSVENKYFNSNTGVSSASLIFNGLNSNSTNEFSTSFWIELKDDVISSDAINFSITDLESKPVKLINQLSSPSADRITKNETLQFVKDELLIYYELDDETADEKIVELSKRLNAKIIGGIPEKRAYQLVFPNITKTLLLELQKDLEIEVTHATLHYVGLKSHAIPIEDDYSWFDDVSSLQRTNAVEDRYNTDSDFTDNSFLLTWQNVGPETRFYLQHRIINTPEAWNIQTGSKEVKVMIVDAGFDSNHPGLQQNLENVIFDNKDATKSDGTHGIAVAANACADGNAGDAMVGAAWNCYLIYLERPRGTGASLPIALDSLWDNAVLSEANIVNISFGATSPAKSVLEAEKVSLPLTRNLSQGLRRGFDPLFITSAGNKGINARYSPVAVLSNNEETSGRFVDHSHRFITVGWTTPSGYLADRSNYGRTLDIAAPGITTYFAEGKEIVDHGTSYASPLVAGVAALIQSEYPGISAADTKDCLVETSRIYGKPVINTTVSGRTIEHDLHVLDAPSAVLCAWDKEKINTDLKFISTQISGSSYTFKERNVGEKSFESVTIKNTGTRTRGIKHISLVGHGYANFNFDHLEDISLFPDEEIILDINYNPLTIGSHEAYLVVLLDDRTWLNLQLKGNTTGMAENRLVATPNPLDFGRLDLVGARPDLQGSRKIIKSTSVSNRSFLDVVSIVDVEFPEGSPFSTNFTLPVLLSNRDNFSVDLDFVFEPQNTGAEISSARLILSNNDQFEIGLRGDGVLGADNPYVLSEPQEIDFGEIDINSTSTNSLTFINRDSSPHSSTVHIIEFGEKNQFSFIKEIRKPSSEVEFEFSFTPNQSGLASAVAFITIDTGVQFSIPLKGSGLTGQSLSLNTENFDFGAIPAFTGKDLRLTVTNNTQTFQKIERIDFIGDEDNFNTARFQTNSFRNAIAPGQSSSVDIYFEPREEVSYSATGVLSLSSGEIIEFSVAGVGEGAENAVANFGADTIDFGNERVDGFGEKEILVFSTNRSTEIPFDMEIINGQNQFSLRPIRHGEEAETTGGGEICEPQGTCFQFFIYYIPTKLGSFEATLRITSPESPDGIPVEILLKGSADDDNSNPFAISEDSIDFGNTVINAATVSSVLLTNRRPQLEYSIDKIEIIGGDGQFQVNGNTDPFGPIIFGADNPEQNFSVAFKPTSTGTSQATLIFTVGNGDTIEVELTGNGTN